MKKTKGYFITKYIPGKLLEGVVIKDSATDLIVGNKAYKR